MLPGVGWAWLTEALDVAGAQHCAAGGTVTRTTSLHPYGGAPVGTNPNALTSELSYLTAQQPVLFEPAEDYASAGGLMAISKQISGDPNSFSAYTQNMLLPEFWYFTK